MFHTLKQAHILIVDDDEVNRRLLTAQLNYAGFSQVTTAIGGEQALAVFEHDIPDLVILDVMMPGMSGLQVTERIRRHFPQHFIPIILVSALQGVTDRVKGIEAGANDFLSRPFDMEELIARVNSLLALKQARDQLEAERGRLALLYNISQALAAQLDYHTLLRQIISLTTDLTGAAKALMVVLDKDGQFEQKILTRFGETPRTVDTIDPLVLSNGLLGWVIAHQREALIPDVSQDERWAQLPDDDEPVGSAVAVPLVSGGTVSGAVLLVSPRTAAFDDQHLNLLVAIASQAGISLENARLLEEAQQQRARVEALLNQSGDPIFVVDQEGRITRINPAVERIFGFDEAILGQTLQDRFGLPVTDLLIRASEHQTTISGEYTWQWGQPEQRHFNISVSLVENMGYLLGWQDVTALKENERARLANERANTQRVLDTFSRYMSSVLMEKVINDPDILTRRERREAIVLFADLRGFTRLTVEHPPDDVLTMLNDIFSIMIDIVYEQQGVVFDIVGDELMVGFNVPYEQPDASRRALDTAIIMMATFARLKAKWLARGMQVGMGIGINQGPVLLGHVGGRSRSEYSMVGEAINIAHRLVDLAQDGQIIALPEVIADGIPDQERVIIGAHTDILLRGKDQAQTIIILELAP